MVQLHRRLATAAVAGLVISFVGGIALTRPPRLRADEERAVEKPLLVGRQPANKILFLGNSITLHGPLESIGWSGNWGMAASEESRDYVHLLTAQIAAQTHGQPKIMVKNIADFERNYATFSGEPSLKEALDFRADIIILAIGENVSALATEEEKSAYQTALIQLLKTFHQHGKSRVFARSTFWSDEAKNNAMAKACEATGDVFVELGKLDSDETNFARSERKIDHAGVGAHPGDKGMKAIADGIWKAIQSASE